MGLCLNLGVRRVFLTERVLIVAAHSDDEVLGCGGAMARHIVEGDSVSVLFLTDGVSSRDSVEQHAARSREKACRNALKALGVAEFRQLAFPDNALDSIPLLDLVKQVEMAVADCRPTIVYTHFARDLNIDHQITNAAVLTACRPLPGSQVKKILTFEVLSSTEWSTSSHQNFNPNYFVEITPFWEQKLCALRYYAEEMRDYPHSRSFKTAEALAILRGSTNGVPMAEAFVVERIVT